MTTSDNVLDYLDQSFFLDFKAQGQGAMIQFVWIYEHDVDMDALQRLQQNLGKGILGRCIERSPLPFGRARWVSWSPPSELDVAQDARPRSEVMTWCDEQAAKPLSPEWGPPWRMAVQPLADGSTAVSLVVAHVLADGVGMNNAVADAVNGTGSDLGYPPPHSRTKTKALIQDARQFFRDLPATIKALALAPLAAKEVPLHLRPPASTGLARRDVAGLPARRSAELTHVARLPAVTILADTRHWDERAESLGGTSNSLLIGLSSRLCQLLGWLDADGMVNLMFPVNQRTADDTRGNALASAALIIDPANATDLRGIRKAVKEALVRLSKGSSRILAPLALTPFVPNFLANRFQTLLQRSASITCSHFGDLDPAVNRPDGTDAEWFFGRHARTPDMADPALLKRVGGIFFPIASGRLGGHIYISVCYSDADASITTSQLKEIVEEALDDFGVTATII